MDVVCTYTNYMMCTSQSDPIPMNIIVNYIQDKCVIGVWIMTKFILHNTCWKRANALHGKNESLVLIIWLQTKNNISAIYGLCQYIT